MPLSLIFHIVLLTLMIILEILAIFTAVLKKKNWYSSHQKFAFSGLAAGALGFLSLFITKIVESEEHLQPLHAKIGAIALLLLLTSLLSGKFLSKIPPHFKGAHRAVGVISITVAVVATISGVLLILP